MRKIVTAAALALALAAPGSAMAWPHHGPVWGHGWHHGWGWGGVGLGIGLGLGAIAIGESCYRERPIYDAYGEVIGYRTVNACF